LFGLPAHFADEIKHNLRVPNDLETQVVETRAPGDNQLGIGPFFVRHLPSLFRPRTLLDRGSEPRLKASHVALEA
jgi:hypothetical protein